MRTTVSISRPTRFEMASEVLCLRCQAPLERQQPDLEQPARLLGICVDCGAWFLLDIEAGAMLLLPDKLSLVEK